jgi:hypothetical protein
MSKTFRPWKIDEPLLLPPVVQEFVAKDHLARLGANSNQLNALKLLFYFFECTGECPKPKQR